MGHQVSNKASATQVEKDWKIIFLGYQRKIVEHTVTSPINLKSWSHIEWNSNG